MSLTNLDSILAASIPPYFFYKKISSPAGLSLGYGSTWNTSGQPASGNYPVTINGESLISNSGNLVQGQLYVPNPGSGNTYIGRVFAQGGSGVLCVLADKIWHGRISMTSTSVQPITTPTFPARDDNQSSNGKGYKIGLEVGTSLGGSGAGAPTYTVSYTNSDGVPGRTAINNTPTRNNMTGFLTFDLEGNDTGVRSIESITASGSWASGLSHLIVYRNLCKIPAMTAGGASVDPIAGNMVQIYNGTVLFMYYTQPAGTSVDANHGGIMGTITYLVG